MWGWNRQMWEKSKGTTKYEKRTVTCDKNRTNAMLVLLNITMELSNVRKKFITCDVGTAQYEDENVKYEKKNHQMW